MKATPNVIPVIQGGFAVSADPNDVMSTVLGSCVAVCLFDPVKAVGGMNHFLLATASHADSNDLKYGINAMELLINRLINAGAQRENLKAKIFGGARMTDHAGDIGQGNATFAENFLKRENIPCVSASVGGEKARRVQFFPTTGTARQMQITGTTPQVASSPYSQRTEPNITLF
jgi:chemotaxis protein CheD